MKKLLLIAAVFASYPVFAQKMPSDYFEEAMVFFEKEEYGKALEAFNYIVEHHPRNEVYPRAFYNTGLLYFKQKSYDEAIVVFNSILEGDFNEREPLGGDIMSEPYTMYRHNASEMLGDIYREKKSYDTSLYYYALADTTYRFLHFCGNAYASYDVAKALRYADIYTKMGQTDKAIASLLTNVFNNTFTKNSKVIEELRKLLTGRTNLKAELDEAIKTFYTQEPDGIKYSDKTLCFKFLNADVAVPEPDADEEKIREAIRESEFYKMIESLDR